MKRVLQRHELSTGHRLIVILSRPDDRRRGGKQRDKVSDTHIASLIWNWFIWFTLANKLS